ncbi:fasciclin domain-containing protein [Spirosoma foliorum]|uniref:Fasciclin domain-containing protein n=1 Tax=Spirosoma foliorum TaxID=2710596 RepID=A0A7G5GYD4_9BACT|nr:fasciclin domain-containing protein [Spirosoma foliorum]QMW03876.1 fasciclin domain-containing protein [Spirosoma foliorum]
MKIKQSFGLFALGIVLTITTGRAQTTPVGAATSTTYPQGAIAPDSISPKAAARNQKRAMRQSKKLMNQNAKAGNNGTTNTSVQDARYRESSASDGTTMNNSNLTNYNSNNATNPTSGVGSNPNTLKSKPNQYNEPQTTNAVNSDAGNVEAVKGAKMTETPAVKAGSTVRNTSIGDFMASSPNYTTLQNALQSSDLFDMLKGTGPYTLFAPTNNAFKKLPSAVQAGLLDGSNKTALKQLLSYHVLAGSLNKEELSKKINAANGKAQLKTVSGSMLTASLDADGRIALTDEQGNTAHLDNTDYRQANGIVYGVDSVLMPKAGGSAFR